MKNSIKPTPNECSFQWCIQHLIMWKIYNYRYFRIYNPQQDSPLKELIAPSQLVYLFLMSLLSSVVRLYALIIKPSISNSWELTTQKSQNTSIAFLYGLKLFLDIHLDFFWCVVCIFSLNTAVFSNSVRPLWCSGVLH